MRASRQTFPVFVLFVVVLATGAYAASPTTIAPIIVVRIDSVLATDTNEGVDKALAPMSGQLQGLFGYTTYRLVSHQDGAIRCGKTLEFALPGGRILHVTARAIEDDMLALELILFQGARPIMTTDFRLMNNGLLIVGGPHYKEGTLIISIGASAPSITAAQAHMHHRPIAPVPMSAVGAAPDDN